MILFRGIIYSIIRLLPFSSLVFYAEYSLANDQDRPKLTIEEELIDKYETNQLPKKYYDFVEDRGYVNLRNFLEESEELKAKKKLLEAFKKEKKNPLDRVLRTGGARSMF